MCCQSRIVEGALSKKHCGSGVVEGALWKERHSLLVCYYLYPLCKQLSLVSSEAIMNTTAVQESPTNHLTSRYLVTSGCCKHNAADEE